MLHYTVFRNENSTEWVTFVHGAGGSSTIWYKQIRAFTKHLNVILLDLRGHGNSTMDDDKPLKRYSFDVLVDDIISILDKEKVQSSHFVGISLGTILIRHLAERYPDRAKSMVLSGAIVKLNLRSQVLMRFGDVFKSILPYLWLYRLFAHIIMPRKNHRESRSLFVQEARKLCQKEFLRWYKLTARLKSALRIHREVEVNIPALYLMGAEDYMFLPAVQDLVQVHRQATLQILPNCGHVVNVDQPEQFNVRTMAFIQELAKTK